MRRHRHIVRFRHGSDLLHLPQATGPPGVGLDHIYDFTLDQFAYTPGARVAFSGCDRDFNGVRHPGDALEILRSDRIFIK